MYITAYITYIYKNVTKITHFIDFGLDHFIHYTIIWI